MKKNDFEYTYSAPTELEREEIESIKKQYIAKTEKEQKLERLRKLDNKVKLTPMAVSLSMGIIGILIFGLGLTMMLEWKIIVYGIIVSFIGLIPSGFAYLVNCAMHKRLKNKYREEIIKLSDDLLNNEETAR